MMRIKPIIVNLLLQHDVLLVAIVQRDGGYVIFKVLFKIFCLLHTVKMRQNDLGLGFPAPKVAC